MFFHSIYINILYTLLLAYNIYVHTVGNLQIKYRFDPTIKEMNNAHAIVASNCEIEIGN